MMFHKEYHAMYVTIEQWRADSSYWHVHESGNSTIHSVTGDLIDPTDRPLSRETIIDIGVISGMLQKKEGPHWLNDCRKFCEMVNAVWSYSEDQISDARVQIMVSLSDLCPPDCDEHEEDVGGSPAIVFRRREDNHAIGYRRPGKHQMHPLMNEGWLSSLEVAWLDWEQRQRITDEALNLDDPWHPVVTIETRLNRWLLDEVNRIRERHSHLPEGK